jgi:hypothetical protein
VRRALTPALLVVAGLAGGCGPEGPCGFGERAGAFGCEPADTLIINIDERTDGFCEDGVGGPECAFRSGIGVNACPVRPFTTTADRELDDCRLFLYPGTSPDETFAGDAGALIVGLFESPVTLSRGPDHCYDSDLFPTRDDLFEPGDELSVSGFGGADFPSFNTSVIAPAPLVLERPTEVRRGEPLQLRWEPSDAERVVVIVVTHVPSEDRGARINCLSTDDGELNISAALTDRLQEADPTAQIFVLRQNAARVEPPGSRVVIEASATTSESIQVPLR